MFSQICTHTTCSFHRPVVAAAAAAATGGAVIQLFSILLLLVSVPLSLEVISTKVYIINIYDRFKILTI